MKDKSVEKNRRTKNDVITIDDDDPPSGQSTQIPSPEVAQLQNKVAQLQQDLAKENKRSEGAIRIAGEYKAQVQALESAIDNKRDVQGDAVKEAAELRKRLDDLGKQFDAEKKKREEKAAAEKKEKEHISLMLDKEMKRGENEREREEKRAADERQRAADEKQRYEDLLLMEKKRAADDKQRYEDLLSIEKMRAAAKANADKEQLNVVSAQFEEEKKKVEAKDAQVMALQGENAQLKEEVVVVKRKIGQLKCDLEKSKNNERLSQNEIDKLKRTLKERSEDVKNNITPPLPPPISSRLNIPPTYDHQMDNSSTVPDFTRPLPKEKKEEQIESQDIPEDNQIGQPPLAPPILPSESANPIPPSDLDNLSTITTLDSMEEEGHIDDENSGMGETELENSANELQFNNHKCSGTMNPSDLIDYSMHYDDEMIEHREATPVEKETLNDSFVIGMDGIDQSEGDNDLVEDVGEKEIVDDQPTVTPSSIYDNVKMSKRRGLSRNVSKSVQYAESVENSNDVDDEPMMKKHNSESKKNNGKIAESRDGSGVEMDSLSDHEATPKTIQLTNFTIDVKVYKELASVIAGDRDGTVEEKDALNELESNDGDVVGVTQPEMSNDPIEEEGENEKTDDQNAAAPTDTSDTDIAQKRRRQSRMVSKPVQYTESMENSDEDEPVMKKSRSESEKKGKKTTSFKAVSQWDSKSTKHVPKKSDTDIECPECEYRTRCARTWTWHLKVKHFTTSTKAGVALRCECGYECYSDRHSRSCNIANFTVIRKEPHPKLNYTDLECPECEFRTRSVGAWDGHLRLKHRTNPTLAGFALLCECGHSSYNVEHRFMCDLANFTVIRKREGPIRRIDDEKTTPQCILCEIYPKTPYGYIDHLRIHHKTTLRAHGIYLKCACDFDVRSHNYLKKHDKKCDGRQFSLHKLDED